MSNGESKSQLEIELAKLPALEETVESTRKEKEASEARDAVRQDGSQRQDDMHESMMEKKRERYRAACAALEKQKKVIKDLSE